MVRQFILYAFMAYLVCSISAMEEWKEKLLHIENANRALHGVPALRYKSGAQIWSDHLGEICDLKMNPHAPKDPNQVPTLFRGDRPAGENIGKGMYKSSHKTIEEVARERAPEQGKSWYKEIKNYPFGDYDGVTNKITGIGHFTQQVWKSSEEVGYGLTTCNGDTFYVVARYFPPGNERVEGVNSFKTNVLPPL